jgi:cobalt-zinc-cadmium efflux system outer membrane protein
MRHVLVLLLAAGLLDAAGPSDRAGVSRGIEERTGHRLNPDAVAVDRDRASLPPGVSLEKPLSVDDAVAIALWRNRALEATLAELGVARGDLVEAGLLRNPNLSLLFPVGPKPFELLVGMPVEALWQRPRRIAAARLQLESVAEGLVQHGLDLAREVKIAHADVALAEERSALAREAAELLERIAELTGRRVRAGDAGELELTLARLQARAAEEQAARQRREVEGAGQRLRFLLGLDRGAAPLAVIPVAIAGTPPSETPDLVETALASRPELRAAEMAVQAAARRAGWERSRILALAPALSSKGVGTSGVRSGPGLSLDLPLLNRNQGAISRAEAEVERAARRYRAAREQVEAEVSAARIRWVQSFESLERIRAEILPAARRAAELAEKTYRAGEESYLYTLEASRRIQEARWQEAAATAEVRQAVARLEHAAGRNLGGVTK